MSNKIKTLFDELRSKYPEVISEEFASKVVAVVEEIVESEKQKAIDEIRETESEKIREEISEEVKDQSESEIEKLVNTLDVFCENAVNEFCDSKAELLEEATKSTISSVLAEKMKEVFETYGIVTEESAEVKADLEKQVEELNETIGNMADTISELSEEKKKSDAISVVDEFCSEMNMTDTVKFYKLIEDYDIDDVDSFREKVESLASVFEQGKESDEDEDEDEDEDPEDGGGRKVEKKNIKDSDEKEDKCESDDEDASFISRVRKNLKK